MRYLFWFSLILLVLVRYITHNPPYHDGQKVRVTDRVSLEPIKYETAQSIVVADLRAFVPLHPEINYGDLIVIEGRVEDGRLKDPIVLEVIPAQGFLYKFRNKLIAFYQSMLSEPHASFVAGVTIGSRGGMPPYFWEQLKDSGTAHVVVASGMNVTLVAGFLIKLLISFFSRRTAIPLALIGIWGYSVIAGFDAPIIRAAIMGSLALSAQAMGRIYYAWRILFVSALGMLIYDPTWIRDLSFLLSFGATASLMLFQARVDRYVKLVPGFFREGLSTSLAAQVGVFPILYFTFGRVNILSPLINAAVLWSVAPITIISMLAGLVGVFLPSVGMVILFLVYPLTSWFILVVDLASSQFSASDFY